MTLRYQAIGLMNQLIGAAKTSPVTMNGKRVITLDVEWVEQVATLVIDALNSPSSEETPK